MTSRKKKEALERRWGCRGHWGSRVGAGYGGQEKGGLLSTRHFS